MDLQKNSPLTSEKQHSSLDSCRGAVRWPQAESGCGDCRRRSVRAALENVRSHLTRAVQYVWVLVRVIAQNTFLPEPVANVMHLKAKVTAVIRYACPAYLTN